MFRSRWLMVAPRVDLESNLGESPESPETESCASGEAHLGLTFFAANFAHGEGRNCSHFEADGCGEQMRMFVEDEHSRDLGMFMFP